MAWRVEFLPSADRDLKKLDPQAARRVLSFLKDRIEGAVNPRSLGQALKGSRMGEFWKYRVGDLRIIAKLQDAVLLVLVVKVGHRRDVYR